MWKNILKLGVYMIGLRRYTLVALHLHPQMFVVRPIEVGFPKKEKKHFRRLMNNALLV